MPSRMVQLLGHGQLDQDVKQHELSLHVDKFGYLYNASVSIVYFDLAPIFCFVLANVGVVYISVLFALHFLAIIYTHRKLYTPRQGGNISLTLSRWILCRLGKRILIFPVLLYIHLCQLWQRCRVRFLHLELSNDFVSSSSTDVTADTTLTITTTTVTQTPGTVNLANGIFVKSYPINSATLPGVSIIKPLCGIDPNLEVNLTSYFELNYPNYELLFCVGDPNDPSCKKVQQLIFRYPNVPAKLLVTQHTEFVNPKINNLQAGYDVAKYDFILVSDAGIIMLPDTLTVMIQTFLSDRSIGLVHQVPFVSPYAHHFQDAEPAEKYGVTSIRQTTSIRASQTFSWIIQLVYFGCWHARMYMLAALFGVNCTSGMSCLMRKSVLDEVGGFKPFGCYLAEDFFLAKHFYESGWKVRMPSQPAWQNSPSPSVQHFFARTARWLQLRFAMVPLVTLLEPLSNCFPTAMLGSICWIYLSPDFVDPGVYFLFHVLTWLILDYLLLCQMYPYDATMCISKVEYSVAWLFCELCSWPMQFAAILHRGVLWRDRRYRLRWGGTAELTHCSFASSDATEKSFTDSV